MDDSGQEAPFVGVVLECDHEEALNDSFSTLGVSSITEEEISRRHQKEKTSRKAKQPLERWQEVDEESTACRGQQQESLRTLLRKGSLHCDECDLRGKAGQERRSPPQFQGNRWLESCGKSVSCRNLSYDASCEQQVDSLLGGLKMPIRHLTPKKSCRDIVSEAIQLAGSAEAAAARSDNISEADDIDNSSHSKSRHSRMNQWIRSPGLSKSFRHFTVQEREQAPTLNITATAGGGGVDRPHHKRNTSVTLALSEDDRKSMLTMGKPLSFRNLSGESSSGRASPLLTRPAHPLLSSGNDDKEEEEEEEEDEPIIPFGKSGIPMSPFVRSKKMTVGGRSKSVRNLKSSEAAPLSPKQRSAMMKYKSKSSRHLMSPTNVGDGDRRSSPMRSAMKFKSKSSRHLTTPTTNQGDGDRRSSPKQSAMKHKSKSSRHLMTPTTDDRGPQGFRKAKSVRHLVSREAEEEKSTSGFIIPATPMKKSNKMSIGPREQRDLPQAPATARASFNGRKFVSYSRSLSCKDLQAETTEESKTSVSPPQQRREVRIHRRTKTFDCSTATSMQAASDQQKPKRSSWKGGSLSAFLEKAESKAEAAETAADVPVVIPKRSGADFSTPSSRRSLLAKSKSERSVADDSRRARLARIKSLSARHLSDGMDDSMPGLSPISPAMLGLSPISPSMPGLSPVSPMVDSPATTTSTASMTVEEEEEEEDPTTTNEMEDVSTPSAMEDVSIQDVSMQDDSMPGLSPMTPVKPSCFASRPAAASTPSLPVVEETSAVIPEISSPPLTSSKGETATGAEEIDVKEDYDDVDADEGEGEEEEESTVLDISITETVMDVSNNDKQEDEEEAPVFSTEEIRKEIGAILDMSTASDVLPPIRENDDGEEAPSKNAMSSSSTRRARCSFLLAEAKAKEMSNALALHDSHSSLKAALHKSKEATRSRRGSNSNSDGQSSASSSEGMPSPKQPSSLKAALNKSKKNLSSHGRRSSKGTKLVDSSLSGSKPSSGQRKLSSSGKQRSSRHVVKAEGSSPRQGLEKQKSYRTSSKNDSGEGLSASAHCDRQRVMQSSANENDISKSQHGSVRRKASRTSVKDRSFSSVESSRSSRSRKTKKESSLSASLNASSQGFTHHSSGSGAKKESSVAAALHSSSRDMSSRSMNRSSRRQRSSRKDEDGTESRRRTASRSLSRRERSSRKLVVEEEGLQRRRSSSLSCRKQRSSRKEMVEQEGCLERKRSSSRSCRKQKSSRRLVAEEGSSSSQSCRKQRSSRKLVVEDEGSERKRSSSQSFRRQRSSRKLAVTEEGGLERKRSSSNSKRSSHTRRSARTAAKKETRPDSPSCVTEYSAGERPQDQRQAKEVSRRKKRTTATTIPSSKLDSSSRRSQRASMRGISEDKEAKFGSSLRDFNVKGQESFRGRVGRFNCSWTNDQFNNSVVW